MFNTMALRKRPYFLGIWLSREAGAWIDQQSPERKRSEYVRRMLAYAQQHMPDGWSPETPRVRQPDHRG